MSFLLCKQTTKLSKNWTKLSIISFWTGKPDKIKITVINKQYSDGGVKMIDLFSFNKSFKTIWIKNILIKQAWENGNSSLT